MFQKNHHLKLYSLFFLSFFLSVCVFRFRFRWHTSLFSLLVIDGFGFLSLHLELQLLRERLVLFHQLVTLPLHARELALEVSVLLGQLVYSHAQFLALGLLPQPRPPRGLSIALLPSLLLQLSLVLLYHLVVLCYCSGLCCCSAQFGHLRRVHAVHDLLRLRRRWELLPVRKEVEVRRETLTDLSEAGLGLGSSGVEEPRRVEGGDRKARSLLLRGPQVLRLSQELGTSHRGQGRQRGRVRETLLLENGVHCHLPLVHELWRVRPR
mmetsp:Transcript_12685/g.23946  ORF Transcript_12685/g.23946 Transcript_12685/m.23946 type:complete len:266 (-) Transcript_12685:391-1188(-)